jgi:ferritin-like protein
VDAGHRAQSPNADWEDLSREESIMTARETMRMNRTASMLHPDLTKEMVEATREFPPSSSGDGSTIHRVRAEYLKLVEPIGSMPVPISAKGVPETPRGKKGQQMLAFMDRLGERLAFERSGTRLYEAFLSKTVNADGRGGAVDVQKVQHFLEEEHEHFRLLVQCVEKLDGDPTAVTPAANIAAVQSIGLVQVMTDPRTTVDQCLCAILTAELADRDGWELLVALAHGLGHKDIAKEFEQALHEESEHLTFVREWVKAGAMREAGITR